MLKISNGEAMPSHNVIETPSFGLNYVLNGGFWTGRFHILWGTPQSGKTTFLYHVLAEAEKQGYQPFIVDAERTYTDDWAVERCGISMDREVVQTNEFSAICNELIPVMKSNKKYAILIDSINAIELDAFYDKADGSAGMGSGARARRQLFTKLINYCHPENNIVFMVSQQTMDLSGYAPRLSAKIGKAEEHFATNIVRLFASSAKDNLEREATGMITNKKIEWTVEKSKQGPVEGTKGSYRFSPQTAYIDRRGELVDLAVSSGLIAKRGPWFYYEEEKFQGLKALISGLSDDSMQAIEKELMTTDLVFEREEDD
jgi:recombination protein RecA